MFYCFVFLINKYTPCFSGHTVLKTVYQLKGYSYSSNCLNHFTGSKYIIEHNLFTNISLDILNRQTCSSLHLYKCERLCIVFFYFFFNYIILVNVLDESNICFIRDTTFNLKQCFIYKKKKLESEKVVKVYQKCF